MSVLEEHATALADAWKTLEAITVDGENYLSIQKLQSLVSRVLYPDGIADDVQYREVIKQTTGLAMQHGYAGETSLRPPQVSFDRAGLYLRQQPKLDAKLLSEEYLGSPYKDVAKPFEYYVAKTVRNKIAAALHGTTRLASAELKLLDQQLDAAMVARGWQRTSITTPRYERPIQPQLEHLHDRLVAWLKVKTDDVHHNALFRQATTIAFGCAYSLPKEHSDGEQNLFQPLFDYLPAALKEARFELVLRNGFYRPRPLDISADFTTQFTTALDSLPTLESKHGCALPQDEIWTTIRTLLGKETLSSRDRSQIERGLLAEWLRRNRYAPNTRYIRGWEVVPPQDASFHGYIPLCPIVQNVNHQIAFGSGKGKEFPFYAPLCIVDDVNHAIVCLQMIGNPQVVKANWARLMNAYQSPVEIDDVMIRQRGMKQHLVFKRPLPLGQVEWVLLHKQASYEAMQPDEPFYVLDDGETEIPPAFFAMLDNALPIPLQKEWATYLWRSGRALNMIHTATRKYAYGKMAWRIDVDIETWERIIKDGFSEGEIALLLNGKAVEMAVSLQSDQEDPLPIISTYTTEQAIEDGTVEDVKEINARFAEADAAPVTYSYNIPHLNIPDDPLFPLGRIVATPGALEIGEQGVDLSASLLRHANADWGEMDAADLRANDHALKHGNRRLFSSYDHTLTDPAGDACTMTLWIITEANRAVTTLLLPNEY